MPWTEAGWNQRGYIWYRREEDGALLYGILLSKADIDRERAEAVAAYAARLRAAVEGLREWNALTLEVDAAIVTDVRAAVLRLIEARIPGGDYHL